MLGFIRLQGTVILNMLCSSGFQDFKCSHESVRGLTIVYFTQLFTKLNNTAHTDPRSIRRDCERTPLANNPILYHKMRGMSKTILILLLSCNAFGKFSYGLFL